MSYWVSDPSHMDFLWSELELSLHAILAQRGVASVAVLDQLPARKSWKPSTQYSVTVLSPHTRIHGLTLATATGLLLGWPCYFMMYLWFDIRMLLPWILQFCTQTSFVLNLGKAILSEGMFCEKPDFSVVLFPPLKWLYKLETWWFSLLGFFQSLAVHNPILFHVPGIIYFCFLPKRKGRLQAIWDTFGFSPGANGVSCQNLWMWQQTGSITWDMDPGMRVHHSWIFSEIYCLAVFSQNCHVWWGQIMR